MIPQEKVVKGLEVFHAHEDPDYGIIVTKRVVHSVARIYITMDKPHGDRYEFPWFTGKYHLSPSDALAALITICRKNADQAHKREAEYTKMAGRALTAMENPAKWQVGKSGTFYTEKTKEET